ncbi:MAG: extracellular solute-binding protein [Atribacterota bacterium]|mgnify:FL=1|jgi:spermidine/putrescine transport system substrate-binding protein|uniref:ABC transporter substrate-binding protein n=1 Tax=Atribacter sp. TaxID=2847780 RepID=UPI00176C7AEA|nr:extracellular solute-binding protein [Atribacterota bacterium]MDI9594178.1 extracellular solute-binding protein [Atribacterota bacterium]HHT09896.1 extracellular solute-binding protein [Candidatus Atribacteria bacterium]
MFKQKFFSLFLAIVFVAISLLFSLAYAQETLNILCFQGYTEDVWVKEFERLTGVKVNATYSGMVEEMFTKAAAGGGQYDLVTIDCGSVQRYYENNLLQPIDLSKISNWEKVSQKFKDIDFTVFDGKPYHVSFVWGSNNVVYNKDAVGELPTTWSVLWDPKYKGQVSITDEANNNVVVAAIALGFPDPYNLTEDQFKQVKEKLIEIKRNLRTLTVGFDSEKSVLGSGETNLSVSGYDSGLILYLRDELKMNVGRLTPKEGIYVWADGWVILKDSKNPDLAHKWIDFMLSDFAQKELAKYMGFGAVTSAAKEVIDPDIVKMCNYDDIDNVPVPVFLMKSPEDFEARVNLWNEVKATQ